MSSWFGKIAVVLGIWIVISPWVLGFASFAPALWSNIAVGAAVALLGFWQIFGRDDEHRIK